MGSDVKILSKRTSEKHLNPPPQKKPQNAGQKQPLFPLIFLPKITIQQTVRRHKIGGIDSSIQAKNISGRSSEGAVNLVGSG